MYVFSPRAFVEASLLSAPAILRLLHSYKQTCPLKQDARSQNHTLSILSLNTMSVEVNLVMCASKQQRRVVVELQLDAVL